MSLSQYDNDRLRAIEDRTRREDPVFAARFTHGCAQLGDPRAEWLLPVIAAVVFATLGVTVLLFSLLLATDGAAVLDRTGPSGASAPPVRDGVRVNAP
ncbi:Protein of unknown function (DUF3040) [Murinocardiopsis flavida]|uniref:DUF3040 family protein n=1 Tax=Murinocardiopsis flavida TaxID=645275 RepID=A0A2P8DFA4_9ACTN|nr:DUF3040 domain-containing protein [Murinocardiopsis flavida]PSK95896.1 Protein of unknown function (DUF3040) [Murinocardiopsis flavida]